MTKPTKRKLETIRLMRANQWTGDLEKQSRNNFIGRELFDLGIKVSEEHLTCTCARQYHNVLRCIDHKKNIEHLNRSEMLLIDQLDQEKVKQKIKNLRGNL